MQEILEVIEKVNAAVNSVVWGWPMIILILGTGILLTVRTKALQVRKFGAAWGETIIPTFKEMGKKKGKKEKTVSPFEAFATAISGTVGTGNIVGVTSAIMTGGPGAVFWMWVSAFFGMVTNYAESVLGLYFRKRETNGEFSGGPAYYLSEGFKNKGSFLRTLGKILAVAAAAFCAFAAVGMSGVQTNKIAATFQGFVSYDKQQLVSVVVGVVVAVLIALIILGGIKSIGRVASIIVPFMSLLFIVMSLIVILANVAAIGNAFALIFANIFKFESAAAGIAGYAFSQIIQKGLARGVFSNEAGLGSSVIAQSASEEKEPVKQGLWGVFGVFFDTFIICTLTALVVLVSFGNETGMRDTLYANGAVDTAVVMGAFENVLGGFGSVTYAIVLPLFAFTTVLAWAYYGEKSVDYLFRKTGEKGRKIAVFVFKVVYILLIVISALIDGELAWAISDTCNGLMALPNLVGVIFLSGLVVKITKNYFDRKKGIAAKPMLSAYEDLEEEFIVELTKE